MSIEFDRPFKTPFRSCLTHTHTHKCACRHWRTQKQRHAFKMIDINKDRCNKWRRVTISLGTDGQPQSIPYSIPCSLTQRKTIMTAASKMRIFTLFDSITEDQWTDGPTEGWIKPLLELRVYNKKHSLAKFDKILMETNLDRHKHRWKYQTW